MSDVAKNKFGLTPDQVGVKATNEKPAVYPRFDVRGNRYPAGEGTIQSISSTEFVIVPAGVRWNPKQAAEQFQQDQQVNASISQQSATLPPRTEGALTDDSGKKGSK